MASNSLDSIEQQLKEQGSAKLPPLHLWDPPLSGDIAIRIASDGSWYHEGGRIERETLVRLFASILRREADGEYYLVTPVEKWRIEVELHPLLVTDIDCIEQEGMQTIVATLNTGRVVTVNEQNSLFLEPEVGMVAAMKLRNGLTALFSRPAWYRLVELASASDESTEVVSGHYRFDLAATG